MKALMRNARIEDSKGNVVFEQKDIIAPDTWSDTAVNIVASKYFYGKQGTEERETSVYQVVERITKTIAEWGLEDGYFKTKDDMFKFKSDLYQLLIEQKAIHNSPVLFSIGTRKPAQSSACFILDVEDSLDSILDWWRTETIIFNGGSGTGINISKLRSSKESLSSGGKSSGPVSFMRSADNTASVIKSGGKVRRAAKLHVMNIDHPDIEEFIDCKVEAEKIMRVMKSSGLSDKLDDDHLGVPFQSSNHSVMITHDFMEQVKNDDDWTTFYVKEEGICKTYKAQYLMRKIAEAIWDCGDPGLQFYDTINNWNTLRQEHDIVSSNPCGEYYNIPDSACNLAALKLTAFYNNGIFDIQSFRRAIDIMVTSQDILIDRSYYPTDKVRGNSIRYRALGLGFTDLGGLLMRMGVPYDSDKGRHIAACLASIMTAEAYLQSHFISKEKGPFEGIATNRESMKKVLRQHSDYANDIYEDCQDSLSEVAVKLWEEVLQLDSFRNCQVTLFAPNGCLVGESLILTSDGIVELSSLDNGSGETWQDCDVKVLQSSLKMESANKFFINNYNPIYKLTTQDGRSISGTGNHQIKIIATDGKVYWRRLDEFDGSELVPVQIGGHEEVLGNKDYIQSEMGDIDMPQLFDEATAEMIGFYQGNGYLKNSHGPRLAISNQYPELEEHFEQWAKNHGYNLTKEECRGCYQVTFGSRKLVRWFELHKLNKEKGINGEGAATAFIPEIILKSRTSVVCAFLRGLFEADGTINMRGQTSAIIELSTVSNKLANQVQIVLGWLGIKSKISVYNKRDKSFGKRPLYRIRISNSQYAKVFGEKIGFISNYKNSILSQITTKDNKEPIYHNVFVNDLYECSLGMPAKERHNILSRTINGVFNLWWSKKIIKEYDCLKSSLLARAIDEFPNCIFVNVSKIEKLDDRATYDIHVPNGNYYISNGFVSHNTTGMVLDCDTLGIEPEFSLVRVKTLAGGGSITIVNQAIDGALETLGYDVNHRRELLEYLKTNGTLEGSSLEEAHLPVFDCAMPAQEGGRYLSPEAHIKMVAALQPHISAGISKTINVPCDISVEEIEKLIYMAWELGVKGITFYRDGCKAYQPLSTVNKSSHMTEERNVCPVRRKLPDDCDAIRHKFRVGEAKGYMLCGTYPDGSLGEVFVKISKEGSTIAGLMDTIATLTSIALQYGVPLSALVEKFSNSRFEPSGFTDNEKVRSATSLVDYMFRVLGDKFSDNCMKDIIENEPAQMIGIRKYAGPVCPNCGSIMVNKSGSCWTCTCGTSSGGCG